MTSIFNYEKIAPWVPYLFKGLGITLSIAFLAGLFGLALGILLTVMSNNKVIKWIPNFYIDIFRGTPLILQLSVIYFAIPQIVNVFINEYFNMDYFFTLNAFVAAVITFTLNSAAYISEIIRSGINSVDSGEIEAARSLGVKSRYIYKDIILPTALKNSFPALMNEFVTLVKESSIVSIIGIQDLMRRQAIVTSQTYLYFEPLIIIGIIYYVVIKILSYGGKKVEARLAYDQS